MMYKSTAIRRGEGMDHCHKNLLPALTLSRRSRLSSTAHISQRMPTYILRLFTYQKSGEVYFLEDPFDA
eukprot:scaffold932_cov149-Cylindrotheca_fusiformis.AAC.2